MELSDSGAMAFGKGFGQSVASFLVGTDQRDRQSFRRNGFGILRVRICHHICVHCISPPYEPSSGAFNITRRFFLRRARQRLCRSRTSQNVIFPANLRMFEQARTAWSHLSTTHLLEESMVTRFMSFEEVLEL